MPKTLRNSYANDLAALEHRPQTGTYIRTNDISPERLRALYCSDLDSRLARG